MAGRFGDFHAPFLQGVVDYANRKLEANLFALEDRRKRSSRSRPACRSTSAFRGVKQRRVEGPLSIHARGDSVDLGIAGGADPGVNRVRGSLSVDVNVGGTWKAPQFAGA